MKKFINQKSLDRAAKGALAFVLAGSITMSATNVFAEEKTAATTTNLETVDLTKVTTETQMNTTNDSSTVEGKGEVKTPSLMPGDFFYFTKIVLEKIKLAFTFDNVEEAELLAVYANERLAEAEKLFEKGEEKLALKTIQDAVEYIKNADTKVEDEDSEKADEKLELEDKTEVKVEKEEKEEKEAEKPVLSDADKEAVEEVKQLLSQNIISLTAALEKVENPKAKAALQKNIDKSYKKLAMKISKLEEKSTLEVKAEEAEEVKVEKEDVKPEEKSVIKPQEVTTINTEVKTETKVQAVPEKAVPVKTTVKKPAGQAKKVQKEATKQVKAQKKEVKQQARQEIKKVKQDTKQEIKEVKQAAKKEIKAIKNNVKVQKVVPVKNEQKESEKTIVHLETKSETDVKMDKEKE